MGRKTIERCSRQKNCISNEQHDSCNEWNFYQSANNKVIFDASFKLKVRNFMTKSMESTSQMEWDQGDFEEDMDIDSDVQENEYKSHDKQKF